jgi:hypothetical protein
MCKWNAGGAGTGHQDEPCFATRLRLLESTTPLSLQKLQTKVKLEQPTILVLRAIRFDGHHSNSC